VGKQEKLAEEIKSKHRLKIYKVNKLFTVAVKHNNSILYYDQQMHSCFINYHTPSCFDTIVSSSGS